MLSNTTFLITGIADKHSLAMFVAKQIIKQGGKVVCTGLGVSKHHTSLSEKAKGFLNKNYEDFIMSIYVDDIHAQEREFIYSYILLLALVWLPVLIFLYIIIQSVSVPMRATIVAFENVAKGDLGIYSISGDIEKEYLKGHKHVVVHVKNEDDYRGTGTRDNSTEKEIEKEVTTLHLPLSQALVKSY